MSVFALLVVGLGLTAGNAAVDAQAPQVRMRWQDFAKDTNRVASFAKAVQVMRANSKADKKTADYRRSWEYWGAMHSYYGPDSSKGTVKTAIQRLQNAGLGQYVGRFKGISDLTKPDSTAAAVWDKCQHSSFQGQQFVQAENFFGWHRIYLYYFEKVLRASAGDRNLRLPYWDYTDPAQVAFPSAFGSVNGKPVTPPLFDIRRTPGFNDGSEGIDPNATNIDTALNNGTFLGVNGYSATIELNVHGTIHCAVGETCPVPYMGAVSVSANDPIFWLHHANIDRMWECWIKKHGTPTGPWRNASFSSIDENGALVSKTVDSLLDVKSPEYIYDNVASCARQAPVLTTAAAQPPPAAPKMMNLAVAKGVTLNKPSVAVTLAVPRTGAEFKSLTASLAGPAQPRSIELVLSQVSVEQPPGAMFHIYVARDASSGKTHVGTLNFFGVGEGHAHEPFDRHFDVTEQVRALMGTGADSSTVSVLFEATTGRVPAPGRKLGATAAPELKVFPRIASVELRLRQAQ